MKQWVADLATTNFRIFVSIMLAVVTVIVLWSASSLGSRLAVGDRLGGARFPRCHARHRCHPVLDQAQNRARDATHNHG
jgi:hypothetical protein